MELTHPVKITCQDGTLVEVPVITLLAWEARIKLECAGLRFKGRPTTAIVRKCLRLPSTSRKVEVLATVSHLLRQLRGEHENA